MKERAVTWTPARTRRLKAGYAEALAEDWDSFTLMDLDENGDVVLDTMYAKYLIEFLDSKKKGR